MTDMMAIAMDVLYSRAPDYLTYRMLRGVGIRPGYILRYGDTTADEFCAWEDRFLREGCPSSEDQNPNRIEDAQFRAIAREAGELSAEYRKYSG